MLRHAVTRLALAFPVAMFMTMAAAEIGVPTGDILLRVTGDITNTNCDDEAVFDRDMLEALPVSELTTSTIWTEGQTSFTGVALSDFLEVVGAEGTVLEAHAVNDYTVDIPVSDAVDGGPIIAYEMNGEEMTRRGKGPLWIVYPYDTDPQYRTETIYSRSIWQLVRLHVRE